MKKNIKIASFLILTTIVCYLFLFVYNKPHVDIVKAETEIRISSKNLVSSFILDESVANAKYVEKVVEVEGMVKEVNFLNDRYTVFLDGGDTFACLMCDMNADQERWASRIKPGQTIRIKGICKGFLVDTILLNCVVLQ